VFNSEQQGELAERLAGPDAHAWALDKSRFLAGLADQFDSWFAVKAFATAQGVPFSETVDFAP
jgi:hypothetical protein